MLDKRKLLALRIVGGSNPFAYRDSWLHTIYVATTGNDTTGNGSKATPYLTLKKALTIAVAGDGILLANGTYAENSGSGYLEINKNVNNWIVIEPELGQSGSVAITTPGTSTYGFLFPSGSTTRYLHFRDLDFVRSGSTDQFFRTTATLSNIVFTRCAITQDAATYGWFNSSATQSVSFIDCTFTTSASAGHYQVYGAPHGITLTGCTLTTTDSAASRCIWGTNKTDSTGIMTITNCVITGGCAIEASGGTYYIDGCTCNGTAAVTAVTFGQDSTPAAPYQTYGYIKNTTITKSTILTGHGLLLGWSCVDFVADNVTIPYCYDYACGVKENTGSEIKNCNFTGGTQAALAFKAVNANAHDNILYGIGSGLGFRLEYNFENGHQCSDWQFQNNIINVSSTAKCLDIGNDTHDAGGGVCDYNIYQNNSGLGKVRNDTAVANLTELQAAWADYDVTTNDSHSTVV